jgi:hypothetical protein
MAYIIYYHRDGQSPKRMYANLSGKEMWSMLNKMNQQAQQPVFYDGMVNEVHGQHSGYYYGERDTEGSE